MNIVCIGSGYVGSVTGTAFAGLRNKTTVIDIDADKVKLMNSGRSPIYEPGLDELIQKYIGRTLFASTSYDTVTEADIIFIGVGTPSKDDGTADLNYIKLAAGSIGQYINPNKFTVIVDKSTVPVGTASLVSSIIEEKSGLLANIHFAVVSNPEFLREGYALEDVFFPDRIVIGSNNEEARRVMRELYQPLLLRMQYEQITKDFTFTYNPNVPLPVYFETDTNSAEMIKYASNAFLAVKISYINEIARLCEVLGANVLDVASGMGMDSRIGEKFLQVSSGWSGSCFPKDTAEILATSQKYGSELTVVRAAVESNYKMHDYIVDKIKRRLKSLNGKTIGILGLTFKPNTDDARKTQASIIVKSLMEIGARVRVHDPKGMEVFKRMNPELHPCYCETADEVTSNADAIILLTHWNEYKQLDWKSNYHRMRNSYILDTRNYLDAHYLRSIGFEYEGIGLGQHYDKSDLNESKSLSEKFLQKS